MTTTLPLADLSQRISRFVFQLQPPLWLLQELQDKLVIVLNHVLSQEPMAVERLRRQQGRRIEISWRTQRLQWLITPAGLLERADTSQASDLRVHVNEESPVTLVQGLVKGQKPAMRIDGDVLLAADINWLVDHVRWDLEEDLSRLVGDAMAHQLVSMAKRVVTALSEFSRK